MQNWPWGGLGPALGRSWAASDRSVSARRTRVCPRAAQDRSEGHLGGILARFGTFLEGKIMVFRWVFQYFLKNYVFEQICVLKPSWWSTWGILGGQERPKSGQERPKSEPRAAKIRPRAAKSGPRAAKSDPRAAKERPRAVQERPEAAQERPKAAHERQNVSKMICLHDVLKVCSKHISFKHKAKKDISDVLV